MAAFKKVYLEGGFVDERETQSAFVAYVGGTARADRLQAIYNVYRHSPVASFKRAAMDASFTAAQVDAYLTL